MNILKVSAGDISDYYLAEEKLRVIGGWKWILKLISDVYIMRKDKLEKEEYLKE